MSYSDASVGASADASADADSQSLDQNAWIYKSDHNYHQNIVNADDVSVFTGNDDDISVPQGDPYQGE